MYLCLQAQQEVDNFLEQAAEQAVCSNFGPAGGKFASKDIRVRLIFLNWPFVYSFLFLKIFFSFKVVVVLISFKVTLVGMVMKEGVGEALQALGIPWVEGLTQLEDLKRDGRTECVLPNYFQRTLTNTILTSFTSHSAHLSQSSHFITPTD